MENRSVRRILCEFEFGQNSTENEYIRIIRIEHNAEKEQKRKLCEDLLYNPKGVLLTAQKAYLSFIPEILN